MYVTGTFDDWKKTEKLEKVDEHFEKTVKLQDASKKIFYKVRLSASIPQMFQCLDTPPFAMFILLSSNLSGPMISLSSLILHFTPCNRHELVDPEERKVLS